MIFTLQDTQHKAILWNLEDEPLDNGDQPLDLQTETQKATDIYIVVFKEEASAQDGTIE